MGTLGHCLVRITDFIIEGAYRVASLTVRCCESVARTISARASAVAFVAMPYTIPSICVRSPY